jgi:hypothetical protein
MPRGEDMCFAVQACHSLIITAHLSTYSWWIAFLMEMPQANIYFNSDFNNSYFSREHFLKRWIPIKLNGSTIIKEEETELI